MNGKIHGNFSQNQRNFTVTSTQLASFGRTWWPLCATWTAAMWAIDPCDWRRATGRRGASDRPNWVIQNYWYSEIYNGDILVNFGDIGIIGYFGEQKKGGMIQQNGNIMGYTYIYIANHLMFQVANNFWGFMVCGKYPRNIRGPLGFVLWFDH